MSSASSRPAWRWYESGGLPAWRRLARIAFALVPAPPDTAALMKSMPGFFDLKSAIIASRPSCSPAPVHHENTSTWSLGASFAGSSADPFGASLGGSLGGSFAGSLALEHAARHAVAHSSAVARFLVSWLIALLPMVQSPAKADTR